MSDFEILQVSEDVKQWTGDHGTFNIFEVEAKGDQGHGFFDLKKKTSSPAPTVGETFDAEIKPAKGEGRKPELKRIWKDAAPGQQRAFGGGGGKNPTERAEIRRMAAQKAAVETLRGYIELAIASETTEQFKGKQPKEILDPLIAYFDDDAREAGERA